jgi:hypothetical protein
MTSHRTEDKFGQETELTLDGLAPVSEPFTSEFKPPGEAPAAQPRGLATTCDIHQWKENFIHVPLLVRVDRVADKQCLLVRRSGRCVLFRAVDSEVVCPVLVGVGVVPGQDVPVQRCSE